MRRGNSYIGASIERVEDLRFLRGRGEYIDDIRRDGQWHAAIFRSSVAHAKIRSIDVSAALAMPGVHAVFTGRDTRAFLARQLNVPRRPGSPFQAVRRPRWHGGNNVSWELPACWGWRKRC